MGKWNRRNSNEMTVNDDVKEKRWKKIKESEVEVGAWNKIFNHLPFTFKVFSKSCRIELDRNSLNERELYYKNSNYDQCYLSIMLKLDKSIQSDEMQKKKT